MKYETIAYDVNRDNIHIYNSYRIWDDNTKISFINYLLDTVSGLKEHRSVKDLLAEWKVHNALYQRKMFVDHTQDVDFEFKQKWYYRFLYWICAKLFKEKSIV